MADCLVELATLDAVESALPASVQDWLTDVERHRLDRITAPLRRRQYLAGHWLVRRLAASGHGGEPGDWRFVADQRGQPGLQSGDHALAVSLSHSADRVAVAVARRPIGLDLEQPGRTRDLLAIAGFTFSPEEVAALKLLPPDQQPQQFYATWSLKEAFGKRCGDGLQPSRARGMQAVRAAPAEAEAWLWQLPDNGVLALAAWPGARPDLRGAGPVAAPGGWRYLSAAEPG